MEISFNSRKLRSVCENRLTTIELLGEIDARRLRNRLADLNAVSSIKYLIVGNPKKVKLNERILYSLNFGINKDVLLEANHLNNPINNKGEIDWEKVSRIKIISIGGNEYGD